MATHAQNIANLRNAVYGEQVRGSMIELFEEDYNLVKDGISVGTQISSISDPITGFSDGAVYINSNTWQLFKLEGTAWSLKGVIRGIQGYSVTGAVDNGDGTFYLTLSDGSRTTDIATVQGIQGPQGPQGNTGATGPQGRSVTSMTMTGTGKQHTIVAAYSDGTSQTVGIVNDGADGSGTGDMSKSTYDVSDHGYVDKAAALTDGTNIMPYSTVAGKADAATTLAGYGITDAYSKTEADGKFMQLPSSGVTAGKVATSDGSSGFTWETPQALTAGKGIAISGNSIAAKLGQGSNITLTDKSDGTIEIAATGAGGMKNHFIITSDAGSTVTCETPSGTVINCTQISGTTTQWECEADEYGLYEFNADLSGDVATAYQQVDVVGEYTVHNEHFTQSLNVYATNGSAITVSDGSGETYTGTGAGSTPVTFVLHQKSTTYTITVAMDGQTKTATVTTDTTGTTTLTATVEYGSIIVTLDADFVGQSITCSDGTTTITKTASTTTLAFYPKNTGTWAVSATLGGQSYSENAVVSSLSTPVAITLNVYTMYGFHVDSTVSDPVAAVSYAVKYAGKNVENYSYNKAYMDFTNDVFVYGDWTGNEFFFPKPVLISQDYSSKIYLNPDDLTKDVNGNDVTSYLTGASGNYNAMMEWGQNGRKIWYKVVPDTDPTSYTVYISDMKVDNDFVAWSFYDGADAMIDHFYTAIYGGSVVSNTLRSLSGKTRMNNVAGATEIGYAKANNQNSEEYAWYIDVFADRLLINFLMILVIGSINSDRIGSGNYTGGSSASSLLTTGAGNTKGMFYGKNNTNSVCKVFGMENYFADQWRRMAGLVLSSGTQLYKLTYGTADGTSSKGYIESDNAPTNYKTGNTIATNLSSSYIKKQTARTDGSLLISDMSGANGTYYSDATWSNTGVRFALVGGDCYYDSACGAFAMALGAALSTAYWNFGASLSLKPLA